MKKIWNLGVYLTSPESRTRGWEEAFFWVTIPGIVLVSMAFEVAMDTSSLTDPIINRILTTAILLVYGIFVMISGIRQMRKARKMFRNL